MTRPAGLAHPRLEQPVPLAGATASFLAQRDLRSRSITVYGQTLARLARYAGPDTPLAQLGPADLQAFMDTWYAGAAAATWNLNLAALRSFYRYALRQHLVADDPSAAIERRRLRRDPDRQVKLAAYLADRDHRVRIGRERLRQILRARGISFQRTRTWKESRDPDRDAKLDRIEYVTSAYPDRCFAFDQFGPLSIRPCHGACRAKRKHPARLRATYHRTHGIRYFHGCYSLGDDQLWGVTREHKGAGHTLAALKSIRAARLGGYRLFIILDNLAANKTPAIRRWVKRENVELCFTPTNASWANPIEAHFGPLRTFVMGTSDYPNHPALARRLQAYLRWRNAHARHPDVLAAQRRERARIRSERQQRWGRPKPKAA